MRLTLAEIALEFAQPAPNNCMLPVTGAAIDSRQIKPGDLFFCLPGEHTDGHDYALKAQTQGCAAIVASRPLPEVNVSVFVVPDPALAMANLASLWRQKTAAKVLCLTGTAGKTTLKQTLAAIMRQCGVTAATKGNYNNQLGLPLTILNTTGLEDFWILELGISHPADMDFLGAIARPDVALVLNVGPGHTEGLGEKGVAWHKAQLLKYLTPGGVGLINADYPDLVAAAQQLAKDIIYFGCKPATDLCLQYALLESANNGDMAIKTPEGNYCFKTPFSGAYGGELSVAATAAATILGASAENIAQGFRQIELPVNRFRQFCVNGIQIFDDTYNANPLSMARMLMAARQKAGNLPFYVVLGAMGELGSNAESCHFQLGEQLAQLKPKAVFWHGEYGNCVQSGLNGAAAFYPVAAPADLIKTWELVEPREALAILFKGSRANKLETYLQAFCNMLEGKGEDTNVL